MINVFYTRIEAAAYLGFSVRTLDRLTQNQQIECIQSGPGCKVRYSAKALDSYLNSITKKAKRRVVA